MKWHPKRLAIIIIFSAAGAALSLAIGYAGKLLSFVPLGPASGQLLAGLHVFWLILVASITKSRGAATSAGFLKGMVEMLLPNHLGPYVFLISLLEGAVVDLTLLPFKKISTAAMLIAGGLSSASNIVILQAFQLLPNSFSIQVYAAMYGASFLSGLVLGGYLSAKSMKAIKPLTQK